MTDCLVDQFCTGGTKKTVNGYIWLPHWVENLVIVFPFYKPSIYYYTGISMDDRSPAECDSGVASTTAGSSFTSSLDTSDVHLEKSSFYHNPNSTDGAPRKKARSSFYGGETLLPPTSENRGSTSNKFASAFNKVSYPFIFELNKENWGFKSHLYQLSLDKLH